MWIDLVQGITYFTLSYFLYPALPGMAWKQLQLQLLVMGTTIRIGI